MILKTITTLAVTATLLTTMPSNAKEIQEIFNASQGGTLTIRTEAGSVNIRTHDRDEIDVHIYLEGTHEDKFDVEFEQDKQGLVITGKLPTSIWGSSSWSRAQFNLIVPRHYNADIDTSGGHIEIDSLSGDIKAETSGGHLSMTNIEGNIDIDTSGGSITVKNVYGKIDGETSGGSINLSLARSPNMPISLDTSGGSISAYLPSESKFDLNAETSGGRVHTTFDVDGSIEKRAIRGRINGGGPQIELSTSGGSVRVDKI